MKQVDIEDMVAFLREVSIRMKEKADYLGQLDGEIGDGDHGYTMSRGFSAIVRALNDADLQAMDLSRLFSLSAESFLDAVGATAGPLYASGMLAASDLADGRKAMPDSEAPMILVAICEGIGARGKAIAGDKTMMDVWLPVAQTIRSLHQEGVPLSSVLADIRAVAARSVENTRSMKAIRGRAARLGDRSLGHIDPGAASAAIIVTTFAECLEQRGF
ncbi:dihydroxyacetone kinase subunit DhaL [uncultured Cohaesibacter sp.]|uniref:dihydroxyacetone kinase subunit DhaL n=1 Tax=uncultured Cohaesibacter sp. TaxID=1002546 RepID=UPI0029C7BA1C|nr:dihydroxyacetone kinase subunit DhaL [uncultured Cohaesibacter sp.]